VISTGRIVPGEPSQSGGPSNIATRSPSDAREETAVIPRPGSDPATDRSQRWLRIAVVFTLAASVALRCLTRSPMWLDEAQTVNIAQRSLPHLFSALREDGSPPLYYVLLHGWMSVFGTSSFAARSLSSVFSIAALPVMAVVARRFRMIDSGPWPAVLLLATCPFVVRYSTEARMYSLVPLLVLLAMLAYERVWSVGGLWPTVVAAAVTGVLVLTQYWSLFLVATVGIAAIVATWRGVRQARRLLPPLVIGCLAFVPWLPSFAYQSAHTGAPWGAPPGIEVPILYPGSWVGGGLTSPLLRWAYYLLAALALAGYAGVNGGVTFRRPVRRLPLLLLGLGIGTMVIGTIASDVASSAYSPRYSMIALAPVLLVIAAGFGALPARGRNAAIAVICGFGLASSAFIPGELRTQAGEVASLLAAAGPHDLVVFCPDQLGPAVHRLVPNAGTQVVYPTFGSPAMVDWVDYAKRNEDANPLAFARTALQRANGHTIWLVYDIGYPTLAGGCSSLYTSFTVARGRPVDALHPHSAFEQDTVAEFPAS
jgi:mannosyltransferase